MNVDGVNVDGVNVDGVNVDGVKLDGPPGLLLIGHGSRSELGVDQCRQLAREVERLAPQLAVELGFIELARPDLPSAIDALVSRGCRNVIGVPLVLLGAGHLKLDGPAALSRGRLDHPGTTFAYARDLGVHPWVLEVAEDRIAETQDRLGDRFAVVLVGRGSSDPDANSDLYKVGRLLADSRGLGMVEPAFVSLAPPSVPEALDRCLALGARKVSVVPYFLFTGRLVERIADQA
ncbi:MAG: sirohydrochlorin chelatase, partial [Mycobacterium sp.]